MSCHEKDQPKYIKHTWYTAQIHESDVLLKFLNSG